jgi:hypothetical protein
MPQSRHCILAPGMRGGRHGGASWHPFPATHIRGRRRIPDPVHTYVRDQDPLSSPAVQLAAGAHPSASVQTTAPTTEDPSPYARFRMKKYCLIREARYAKISSVLFIFNETGS